MWQNSRTHIILQKFLSQVVNTMLKLIIFDLDDVLFPEREYMNSGFKTISKILFSQKKEQEQIIQKMLNFYEKNPKRVFNNLASEMKIKTEQEIEFVKKMLTIYRNHKPTIKLYSDVLPCLKRLHNEKIFTAIITDGREKSQVLKIESLRLKNKIDKIIINDSLGPNRRFWKPNPHPFQLILKEFQVKPLHSCYIGDNIQKDFDAPAKLGMHTILIKREGGIYLNKIDSRNVNTHPDFLIHSLKELESLNV